MFAKLNKVQFAIGQLALLVGSSGLEPPTLRLSGVRSNHLSYEPIKHFLSLVRWLGSSSSTPGGDEEDRTPDPLRARQVLSQLSYTPIFLRVSRFMPLLPLFSFLSSQSLGPSKLNNVSGFRTSTKQVSFIFYPIFLEYLTRV